jgi:hypothetical protein
MGVLDDVMKALDRWTEWGPIRAAPAKIEALEKRVAELECKLDGPWPPSVCRYCGERAARLGHTTVEKAVVKERWDCKTCMSVDWKISTPA